MPLIKCPDCEREVSNLAPACPNCGRPIAAADAEPAKSAAQPETTLYEDCPSVFRDRPMYTLLAIVLCLVIIGFFMLGHLWLEAKSKKLTITNKRTIYRTGIFSKNTDEVRHRDVRNVIVRQTFIDRLFGVGTIAISSAGQSTMEIVVAGMRNPGHIVELIRKYQDQ